MQCGRGYADAGVAHLEMYVTVWRYNIEASVLPTHARLAGDDQRAPGGHCVSGIEREIHEHLREALLIAMQLHRVGWEAQLHRDVSRHHWLEIEDDFFEPSADVDRRRRPRAFTGLLQ